MLEMRPDCERCGVDLPADAGGAFICSFECTYCAECADALDDVQVVSAYPIQPVRFLDAENKSFAYNYAAQVRRNKFQTKLAPGGVTIVDIRRA